VISEIFDVAIMLEFDDDELAVWFETKSI